jgi:hypothetical protein
MIRKFALVLLGCVAGVGLMLLVSGCKLDPHRFPWEGTDAAPSESPDRHIDPQPPAPPDEPQDSTPPDADPPALPDQTPTPPDPDTPVVPDTPPDSPPPDVPDPTPPDPVPPDPPPSPLAATAVSLKGAPSASVFGQPVTIQAVVTGAPPVPRTPSGWVTFKAGSATLGKVPVNSNGAATLSTKKLPVGTHTIIALYSGDDSFGSSSSSPWTQQVKKGPSHVALKVLQNPSVFGQLVNLKATVTAAAPGSGTPLGSVTFKAGLVTLGTAPVGNNGVATCSTKKLPVGLDKITAIYGGDAHFVPSPSLPWGQVVNKDASHVVVHAWPNQVNFPKQVVISATVTTAAPGSGTPTGWVTFKDGFKTLGTAAVNNNGAATLPSKTLAKGTHGLVARYGGDSRFKASTSVTLILKVK